MRRRILVTILSIAAICVSLQICGDFAGALIRTGPYSGRVIDAVSGAPIPDAYVLFGWGGLPVFGEHVSCAGSAIARSDASGTFHLSWQGFRPFWIGQAKLYAPSFTVVAVGYAPSNLAIATAGKRPHGLGGLEPIRMTPTAASWTDSRGFHVGRCEAPRGGETVFEYVSFLQARRAVCDADGEIQSDQLANLPGLLPATLAVVPTGSAATTAPSPASLLRQPLFDALGLTPSTAGSGNYVLSTHDPRAIRACALLDVRAPDLEAIGK